MFFRNLVPNDVPVPRCRYRLEFGNGKWVTVGPTTVFTASLGYIFVTMGVVIWVARTSVLNGHIDIARGARSATPERSTSRGGTVGVS